MSSGAGLYTVTVAPAAQPVTLAEMRAWLKLDSDLTADNDLITALIESSTELAEKYTSRHFVSRTNTFEFGTPYASSFERYPYVDILKAPFASLTSVEVYSGGSFVDITSNCEVRTGAGFPRVLFYDVYTYPPDDEKAYPFKITFTSGYGAYTVVPKDVKTAIMQITAMAYQHRDAFDVEINIPLAAKALLGKYKIMHTFG